MLSEVPDRCRVLALCSTEGGRDWVLVCGGPIEVCTDDKEVDDEGKRTRDFDRVAIVAGREWEQ